MLEKHRIINRVYLILDKPINMSIIDYKWSSTQPEYVLEKLVWTDYECTRLENHLRDGKYFLGIF